MSSRFTFHDTDLRTNYVQFVLAFFKHGDAEIKKQVLGVKGLVSGVFVGMDEDAYPVRKIITRQWTIAKLNNFYLVD